MEKNNKKQRYISGLVGEDIAINEMKKCGFEIVRHRYKTSSGEIDLIAENKEKIASERNVQFELYHPVNKSKLDLSICQEP